MSAYGNWAPVNVAVHGAMEWRSAVALRVSQRLDLDEGWDTYGAPRIGYETGSFALQALARFQQPGLPNPSVVPVAGGGIQFEWHLPSVDLEIHFSAPYEGEFRYERVGSAPASGPIAGDLSALSEPLVGLIAAAAGN